MRVRITEFPPSAPNSFDASGMDLLLAHYGVLKEAGANINGYRQQAVTLVVTAFAPVAGSLIALAAKDKTADFARIALLYSLVIFVIVNGGVGYWAWQMEKRQAGYRASMLRLLNDIATFLPTTSAASQAWKQYPSDQDPFHKAGLPILPVALGFAALAGFIAFLLLRVNQLPGWP